MLRSKALSSAKNKLKQVYRLKGSSGTLTTTTTKKPVKDVSCEGGRVEKEKADHPIAVFSRPPPLPPVLGPLLVVSLMETWSSRDSDDD